MDGNRRDAALTWLCFLAGLFFCGIGCLAGGGTFERWLPASGGALAASAYLAGFLLECRRGAHGAAPLRS